MGGELGDECVVPYFVHLKGRKTVSDNNIKDDRDHHMKLLTRRTTANILHFNQHLQY